MATGTAPAARAPGPRRSGVPWQLQTTLLLLLVLLVRLVVVESFAIEVPPSGSAFYMQTNGPQGALGLGDWYTSDDPGTGNSYHYVTLEVPCGWPTTEPIHVDLFSAEVNSTGVSDETGADGIRDDTRFELYGPYAGPVSQATSLPGPGVDPDGAGPIQNLGATTYAPVADGTPEGWDRFATIDPADCGVYLLRAETYIAGAPQSGQLADDQNAWRVRLGRDDDGDPTTAPPANEDDFDGVPGTNDELSIGLVQISWQQDSGAGQCLTLFEYADGSTDPLVFNNFDMDGNSRVRYYDPSAAFDPTASSGGVVGTVSGNAVWNNGGTSTTRGGDTVAVTEAGWWRSVTCMASRNQFIQENGTGQPDYIEQPPSPVAGLAKDDGLVQTFPGQTLTYTLDVTNDVGPSPGAMVAPTVTDVLPAGTTFASCSWSALPTTAFATTPCGESGGTITAALDGWINAGDSATLEVTVTVDAGTEGTTLTNDATVRFTDGIGRSYAEVSASDATTVGDADVCYAVAGSGDTLLTIDRPTGTVAAVGATGTSLIEAIAVDPVTRTLHAADGGRFGSLDVSTGAFSEIAAAIGTGDDGTGVTRTFDDVDGLTFDIYTGTLWAVDRDASPAGDALFQLDPATGQFVPDAFGAGIDYVLVTGTVAGIEDIDDLAVDPTDGTLYGVANGGGADDVLVVIDKLTGAATAVNPTSPEIGVTDVEGLSFFNDGSLYGSTGSGGSLPDHLVRISTADGKLDTTYGPDPGYAFGVGSDHEALACLNGEVAPNTITGTVYRDLDEDGVFDTGESGEAFVAVRLYLDTNADGLVDAGDTLLDTTFTTADGSYSWTTGVLGDYVIEVDASTLPPDALLTTDDVEVATFTAAGQDDAGNDVGFTFPPILSTTKTSDVTGPVTPGQVITYTVEVTNTSSDVTQTNVTIADAVPAGTTYVDGSSTITRPTSGTETLADAFDVNEDYTQDDGTISFAGPWVEVGDDGDAGGGDIQVRDDNDPDPDEFYAVRFDRDGRWLERAFDASAYVSAVVSWEYRYQDNEDNTFTVDVSNDGGGSWTTLQTHAGGGDQREYLTDSAAVPIALTADMKLRFNFVTRDAGQFWIDDVRIDLLQDTTETIAGGDPSLGEPLTDDTTLAPGETVTATFQVTVDDPTTTATIDNTASATSDQQPAAVGATVSDPVEATIGDRVFEDADGDGVQDVGEAGLAGITVRLSDPGPDGAPGGGDDVLVASRVTGADGSYDFAGLPAGDYVVDVDEGTLPTGLVLTTGNEPLAVTVAAGDDVDTADFGYREEADLSLVKTVSDATANVGDSVTFSVTVTNAGPADATGVEVTDTVPSGMTLLGSTTTQGAWDDATGVWTVGTIAAGASAVLTLTTRVDSDATSTNTAEVTASDVADPDSVPGNADATEDDQDSAAVTPPRVDLVLVKTVDDAAPNVGDQVTYTVAVTNAGPDAATAVEVVDTLPAGVTPVGDTTSQGTFDAGTGTWDAGALASGATATLTITVTVDTVGTKVNTATATAPEFDPDTANNTDTATFTPQEADLSVTKSVDDTAPNVGDTVTFTVTLANAGPDAATNVEVTDPLPAGLGFVSSSATAGTYDETTGVWTIASLASGDTATLTVDATVEALGSRTNTAEVTAVDQFDGDSTPANGDGSEDDQDSATLTPQQVDLAVAKVVDDPTPAFGDTVTFTVTLSNGGPDTATNVTVTDAVPAALGVVAVVPSDGTWAAPVWSIPSLASGATATLTITATVEATGTTTNTAEVTAVDQADDDSTPANGVLAEDDQDDATITVPATVDLELTKTVDDPDAGVGDPVRYLVTLTNLGPDTATGVDVTDLVPAALTDVVVTPSAGTTWTAPVWAVPSLAAGASTTLTIDAVVDGTGTITNTAEVTAHDQVDRDSTPGNGAAGEDDQDTATITSREVDLSLTKTVSEARPQVGDQVTYTITLENAGPDTGTAIAVTDVLPASVTFVGSLASQGTYDSTSGVWTVGDLGSGATATLDITVTVADSATSTNTAEVTAVDEFDPDSVPGNDDATEDDRDTATITPRVADLALAKTVDDPTPSVGDTISYTVTLSNAGPDAATAVEVTDVVPAQLGAVVVTPSSGTWTAPTWSLTSLASGGSATLTITGTVEGTGDLTNTAEVTAVDEFDPDSVPGNGVASEDDQAGVAVTVPATADLSLTKTVDDPTPAYRDTVTFTVTLANDGPDPATNVEVTDAVPAGLTDVVVTPATGAWTAPVWSLASLAVGATTTLTVTGTVDTTDPVTNTAEVTASDQADDDSVPANGDATEDDLASATADAPATVDLEVTKTVDVSAPNVGDDVTFTVVLANRGPDTATGVVVTDVLPAGLTYRSHVTGAGTYDAATGAWTVSDPVAAGGSTTLTLTARVDALGTATNTAEVTAQDQVDQDSTPANGVAGEDDQDSAVVTPQAADLSLTKTVDDATPDVGDTVTFIVTVANSGPDDATGVEVVDALPAGLRYVGDDAGGDYDPATGLWSPGTLAIGATSSLTVTAEVAASGTITNGAQVAAVDQADPDSVPGNDVLTEDDQDEVALTVAPAADLRVAKGVDDPNPNVGDTVTFTVTLTNDGPDDATGVELTDTPSAGLTVTTATAATGTYDGTTGVWSVPTLAAGASTTLTITTTVDATGPQRNAAEVTAVDQFDPDSTPGNGVAGEDDQAAAALNAQVADLSLTKSVDDATPNVGDVVTFTVTVANDGPDAATGVAVTDVLPAGLAFAGAGTTQGSYAAASGVWTVGTVPAGVTATLELRATVTTGSAVTNTAQVAASDQFDPDSVPADDAGPDDLDTAVVTPQLADLELTKDVDDPTPGLGDTVTFTLSLTNRGPDTATTVTVTDLLPPGTTYVAATPSVGTYTPATGAWSLASLASGATATLALATTVDVTGDLTNTAEVTAVDQADPDSVPGNGDGSEDDQDSATATVPPTVDLSLTKTVDDPTPAWQDVVTFTVTVANDGPDAATGVEVTDALPAGLTHVGDDGGGAYDPATGLWTVGGLVAGGATSLQLQARVDATGTLDNVAEVAAQDQPDVDSTPGNGVLAEDDQDTAQLTTPATADLSLTKTVDQPTATIGDTVVFTVDLANGGPDGASGVEVTDLLPPGLTHLADTTTSGTYDPSTGVWSVGSVAAGTTETLTVTATVAASGSLTNSAQVTAADQVDPDSVPANDVAGEDDQDSAGVSSLEADLALAKTVDDATPDVGDTITFTLTLDNAGPDAATDVAVTDVLPLGLSFVSSTASAGSYDVATGVWSVGTLAAAGTATLSLTVLVTADDGGADVVNTAQVAASDLFDPDSTPANDDATEDDQASVVVSPQRVDLELVKSVDTATAAFGDTVTFTVALANAGEDTATGVEVTDAVPGSLTGVTVTPSRGTYDSASGVWTVGSLAGGGDSATLVVTGVLGATGTTTNTAEVTAVDQYDTDSVPANGVPAEDDQDSASVTVPSTIDLRVAKTVDDATPDVGGTVVFTVTVTNDGPDDATGVAVTDALPAGLGLVAHTASQGSYDAVTGEWTLGVLARDAAATLTLTATVDDAAVATNTAEVTAADQVDRDSTPANGLAGEDDRDSATVTPRRADLSLTKTVDDATPDVGGVVTFTVRVSNAGPDSATGVRVTDDLPVGLLAVGVTPSVGTWNASSGVWDVGTLASGRSETLVIEAQVTTNGTLTNVAQVAAADTFDPDSTPGNGDAGEDDQDSAAVTAREADLSLAKSVDDATPDVGATIAYTVTVTNEGPDTATGVVVADVLPASHAHAGDDSGGAYDPGTGLWDVGTLAAGSAATLVIRATVEDATAVTNTAVVDRSDQFDPDPGDDSASVDVTPRRADLSLTTSVDDSRPNVGDEVTFTVVLRNDGPDGATGVEVTALLPSGTALVTASTTGTTTHDPGTGVWTVGAMAAGTVETLTLTATVTDPAGATATAAVTASDTFDPDSTPGNDVPAEDDQDSATITPQVADLALTTTVDEAAPALGDTVTWTVTLTNTGPDGATGVEVTDLLPAGTTLVGATTSLGGYDAASGLWTVGTLAAGGSATLTVEATVDVTGTTTNTAQVTAADQFDPDSVPANDVAAEDDQDAAAVTVAPTIDLSLTKVVDDVSPTAGQVVTFTVTLANDGPDDATGVVVADTLPAGLAFVAARPATGGFDDASGVWAVGSLAAGSSTTLEVDARVEVAGTLVNLAEVTAADQVDSDSVPGNGAVGEDDRATAAVAPQEADLELTKTVASPRPDVGTATTFTLTVTNRGPDTATGVGVTDVLPAGLVLVGATASQGAYDSGTGVWTIGSLAATDSVTLDLLVRVDVPGTTTNSAQVSASDQFDPDSVPANDVPGEDDQDSASITPPQADLAVTKTVDDATPDVGDVVTFTVEVTSSGPDTAQDVTVADALPTGLSYIGDSTTQGSYDPATGIWTIGAVTAPGTVTLTLQTTVVGPAPATNTATVDSATHDPDGSNDTASALVTPQQADLRLDKTVDDATPVAGGLVTYTVTVVNDGPDTATGVVVTDAVPVGTTFVAASPSQGTYTAATGRWSVGALGPAAGATLQLTATVDQPGASTNTAEVTAADQFDPDSTPGNGDGTEDDQASVEVTPQVADLALVKAVDDATPDVGDTITFTITLTNTGPDTATGVEVTDVLPAGLAHVGDVPSAGGYDDTTGLWRVGTLGSGATATLRVSAVVTDTTPSTNTAEVTAADQFDSDSTPGNGDPAEDDQASVGVTPTRVDLAVTKVVDDPTPAYRGTVTFTVGVDNLGPDTASGVVVEDLLPAGLEFVAATPSQGAYDRTSGVWAVGTLGPLGGATLELAARVLTTEAVDNTVTVVAVDQADVDPGNDSATAGVDAPAAADLSVTKLASTSAPGDGEAVDFTVVVANDGPDAATGVTVVDVLPTNLAFTGAAASQGAYDDGTGTWDVGRVPAGATATLTISTTYSLVATTTTNVAELTAADQYDPDSTPGNGVAGEDDRDSASLNAPEADLSLRKTVDDATPDVGEVVTFTITLTNQGPQTADEVAVTDDLPSGLVLVGATTSTGAFDAATGVWTVGTMAPGAVETLVLAAEVVGTDPLTNVVAVTSTTANDPDPTDDTARVDVTPQVADLRLDKTVDDPTPDVGSTVTFTLTVTNAGPDTATGVTVDDLLPSGLTHVGDDGGGAYDETSGTWSVGTVAVGTPATLTVTARVETAEDVVNVAEITSSDRFDPDSTPGNGAVAEDDLASAAVAPVAAGVVGDLVFADTDGDGLADPGEAGLPGVGVELSTLGPDGLPGTADDVLVATTTTDALGGYLFTGLDPGSYVVGLVASTVPDGAVRTTGPATGVVAPDAVTDLSVDVGVQLPIDVAAAIGVDDPSPVPGRDVVLTVSVVNDGPGDATGVTARVALPSGMTYVDDASGGAWEPTTGTWTIGALAAGTSSSFTITATVDAEADLPVVVEVMDHDQSDVDSTPGNGAIDEDDRDEVVLRPGPSTAALTLSRTGDATVLDGETVTFPHLLRNSGDVDDAVTLAAVSGRGWPLTLHVDRDGDGVLDPTDPVVVGVLDVPAGSSADLLVTVTVPLGTPRGTVDTLTLTATSGNDPDVVVSVDDRVLVVAPDLALDKRVDGPGIAVAGDRLDYTLVVRNDGTAPAVGATVLDATPSGTTYLPGSTRRDGVAVPDAAVGDGNPLAEAAGGLVLDVEPGRERRVTFSVRVSPAGIGEVRNVARVTVPGRTTVTSDTTRTPVADPGALEVVKSVTAEDEVASGTAVTWTIEVTNTGALPLDDVVLRDDVPDLTTYVPGTTVVDGDAAPDGPGGAPPLPGGVQVGPLGPGEVVVAAFASEVGAVPDGTVIENVAVVDVVSLSTAISSNVVQVETGERLAETGADARSLLARAALLVALGVVLVWAARRREDGMGPATG